MVQCRDCEFYVPDSFMAGGPLNQGVCRESPPQAVAVITPGPVHGSIASQVISTFPSTKAIFGCGKGKLKITLSGKP